MVGQRHVVRTLSNAIESDKIHHAYLFVGSRGTGKTSMAKILAASLNCENGGPTLTPCGTCESCRSIAAGTSVDVIEMDAASNRSVDDIRGLRDRVAFAPAAGSWKVYILDEAHMLTKEAWNAFLKTLEEPPPNTVFILATTEAHKVMPTIADRCQRFDFQRPSIEQISEVIDRVAAAESIGLDQPAVSMIARSAAGSFRDALGTLDQLVAYSGKSIELDDVLELLGAADADLLFGVIDAVVAGDAKGVLASVEAMAASGRDPARFGRDLLGHLRVLLVTQTTGEIPEAFAVTAADGARLSAQAKAIGPVTLVRTIDELADALVSIREGDEARLAVEVALLKAARPDLDPSSEGLMRRIERLERGAPVPAPGPATPPTAAQPRTDDAAYPPVESAPMAEPGGSRAASVQPDQATAESDRAVADTDRAAVESDRAAAEPEQAEAAGAGPAESPPAEGVPADPGPTEPDPPVAGSEGAGSGDAPPPGSELDREKLGQVWPAVLESLKAGGSGPAASLFEEARPVGFDAGVVTVAFPPESAFNRRNAEKPERRAQLVEALLAVTGERLEVAYESLSPEAGSEAAARSGAVVGEDEFVEKVKSEFNAEEVI